MGFFDKVKGAAEKAKGAVGGYVDNLKAQEAANNKLIAMPMDERAKERGEGVKYCLVNSLGKIMDVYENKVVFTSTASTSTIVTSLVFSTGDSTRGEKTIYYKDAIGVQFKPSGAVDGYIQVETAAGNMTGRNSAYNSENAIQFGKKSNEDAEVIANYISQKIEELKSGSGNVVVQSAPSSADELVKFKTLLDQGIISQEEFDTKKKQLLGL